MCRQTDNSLDVFMDTMDFPVKLSLDCIIYQATIKIKPKKKGQTFKKFVKKDLATGERAFFDEKRGLVTHFS